MKTWLFVTIVTNYLIYFCLGNQTALHEMTKKLCKAAKQQLKIQEATDQDKPVILEYLNKKLAKLRKGDDSAPDAKLISQGISLLSDDANYYQLCINSHFKSNRTQILGKKIDKEKDEQKPEFANSLVSKIDIMKKNQVKEVIQKMETLVRRAIANVTSLQKKQQNIHHLKNNLIDTFSRELMKNDINKNKTNEYSELLAHGFDLTAQKLLEDDSRRMSVEFVGNNKMDYDSVIGQEALSEPFGEIYQRASDNYTPGSTEAYLGLTKDTGDVDGCSQAVKQTCNELKILDSYKCEYDGTTLSTQQVCDGAIDCPDGSDEKNCIQQVIKKVHSATQVMSKVELSRYCFQSLYENSVISRQGKLLSELLKSQIDFLKKFVYKKEVVYMSTTPITHKQRNRYHPEPSINEIVSEVALVIRTFATSLNSALCLELNDDVKRAVLDIDPSETVADEFDKVVEDAQWTASSCECSGQYCSNVTCHTLCKRFCYQIYSLNRLPCKAVYKGLKSVSIDKICDGRLDCFDEVDEMNCGEGNTMLKFEGNKIFDTVINMLKHKYLTNEYISVRTQLVELQVQVQYIQKRSTSPKVYNDSFRVLRDTYFKMVKAMYTEMMDNASVMKNGEEIYKFYMSINMNMIEGMKRTHIGNNRVLTSDNCFCRGAECAQPQCPVKCQKNCAVRAALTSFLCVESAGLNVSVPIDAVCNGKLNCPNAEDEINCSPEICRIHHAKVLRHSINAVGSKYKGSILGDALDTWKNKVSASLVVLENRDRLTPKLLKGAILEILNDLSLTYLSLDSYRRLDTDRILKKFTKLSQHIVSIIKSCTK